MSLAKIRQILPFAAAFEAAANDPVAVARNFAASAKSFGAKYSILTLWQTCGGHMALYPSALPEFLNKTTIDYIGPYLDEARKAGLHAMVYFPTDCNNWDVDPAHPTIGVGPRIDGTLSPRARPAFEHIRKFLAWAGPGIHNTKGPAGTFFDPGYAGSLNGGTVGAYYSVTQSLDDPNTLHGIYVVKIEGVCEG